MKKYVVIYEADTGYADIRNVGIIEALSKEEAINKMSKKIGRSVQLASDIYAFLFDDINEDWYWYN